jgi:hypothetical protein
MNQLDWEKRQENLNITNVARANRSSWGTVKNEYTVNTGTKINGTYTHTKSADGIYESFREGTNWWNTNYGYRKQITITNNAMQMLEAGYSVSILLDTAFFVSAGKMLPNGHDLRIVY